MSRMAMNLRALAFSPTLALLFAALPAHAQGAVPAAAPTQPAPVAEGNDVELARQHFSQATKLYKDGDFDAALVQFERAYEVKPNYKVLYNIGQTYFQLRQYVEARDAMQRFIPPFVSRHAEARNRGCIVAELRDLLFEGHARDEIGSAILEAAARVQPRLLRCGCRRDRREDRDKNCVNLSDAVIHFHSAASRVDSSAYMPSIVPTKPPATSVLR